MPEAQKHSKRHSFELVQDTAWAITRAKMDEINALVECRLRGEKVEFPEAQRGPAGNRAEEGYQVLDGVALLPVYGVLAKRMNLLTEISGGTSMELLGRDFARALADPKVKSILLDTDSPGGTVDGTEALAAQIYAARGRKPIVAFANGLMASAAYWVASAADQVVAPETAQVGSIGVIAMHYDRSEQDQKLGVKRTAIYAGQYKRAGGDEQPLSDEDREYLQERVDDYYALFLEAVARQRGVDSGQAHQQMGDGRLFMGKKALKAGLIDQIGNFNQALALARAKGGAMPDKLSRETLQAENPELFRALLAEGAASVTLDAALAKNPDAAEKLRAEARETGVQAERARVVEIMEAAGDPAVTLEAVKTGAAAAETFKRFFQAEKEGRAQALDDMRQSAPPPLGQQPPAAGGETFEAKVHQLMDGQKLSRAKAIKQAAREFPELHAAYIAQQNPAKK